MDKFLTQKECSRCGKVMTARSMSKMNEDILCMECLETEKSHPRYQEAVNAELEQIKVGNYYFRGLFAGKKYPF